MPLLTYAFPANVNAVQIQQLKICWNSVYRKKISLQEVAVCQMSRSYGFSAYASATETEVLSSS